VKTQLTADVLRTRDQLCTAEHSPQALLPKVPPGLNPKAERAFRKLCEAPSMAEGTSEVLGGCRAHGDPDRLRWRRTSIRQASEKLWAAA
jgi:hypothetical protein